VNNTVCDSPFEVTVAKLRGVRDGPCGGASSDACEFCRGHQGCLPNLPGTRVGANCIRPPYGPGRGRMIRRGVCGRQRILPGTCKGAHTAARLCKGCMIVSHTVKRPCRCCMVPPHTVKGPCRCCMVISHTVKGLCRCCTLILHTVKRPCRCCIVILHTVPAPRRCCTLISHTATGCARPARSFFTPCARVSQRILTISTL